MRHGPASWGGIVPAALTMFATSGALDEDATRRHIEFLVDEGAAGIVVGGTSGEFIALDPRERRRVIELAVEAVDGRVPVIAGTGCFGTAETVELTRSAGAAGADGAIVILPYYQRPSVSEIVDHYRAVGAQGGLPVMAYNNPTNANAPELGVNDLVDLYHGGSVTAVKSTFQTVHQVHELRAHADAGFRVFYGSFMAPLEGLAGGAHGWISGILNVALADARQMYEAIQASDLASARSAWNRILPIKEIYTTGLLGPVADLSIYRAILDARGGWGGASRLPTRRLSSAQHARLDTYLRDHDLLGGAI